MQYRIAPACLFLIAVATGKPCFGDDAVKRPALKRVLDVASPGVRNYARAGGHDVPLKEAVEEAVRRAIPLLEKASAGSAEQRKCFTCHTQAAPVVALVEAREHGFTIDAENLERQLDHTYAHLERGRKAYLDGRGTGGRVDTAGWALWTLEAGGREPGGLTEAVADYLIDYQKDAGRWKRPNERPPTSASDFASTYLAVRALRRFGTDAQSARIEARIEQAKKWILENEPVDTEDRVYKLRTLAYLDVDADLVKATADELLKTQRPDGGWAQTSDMHSDAYATATALIALRRADAMNVDDEAFTRGIRWLLNAQHADGSWQVKSRSKPFQTYYETGFPHGKDQFISTAASSWAVVALLELLQKSGDG